MSDELIKVEVACALPQRQCIKTVLMRPGSTALDAVRQSGIALQFPEINVEAADMGIFARNLDGKTLPLPGEYQVKAGDRVEIYRPLLADPKAARQQRAARAKQARA